MYLSCVSLRFNLNFFSLCSCVPSLGFCRVAWCEAMPLDAASNSECALLIANERVESERGLIPFLELVSVEPVGIPEPDFRFSFVDLLLFCSERSSKLSSPLSQRLLLRPPHPHSIRSKQDPNKLITYTTQAKTNSGLMSKPLRFKELYTNVAYHLEG